MLLNSYQLLFDDPAGFLWLAVLVAISLVTAITFHEFSHAMVATGLGDHTARHSGRLSLNPIRHLDPTGTVMIFIAGFGWGKPVPVNHHRLSHGNTGMALVAAAGPLSNLVMAFLLAVPIKIGLLDWNPSLVNVGAGGIHQGLSELLSLMILLNVLLAVFNLIPLAPLDGSRVVGGLLRGSASESYNKLEKYGPVILVGLILVDFVAGVGILWTIIGPPVRFLIGAAVGV